MSYQLQCTFCGVEMRGMYAAAPDEAVNIAVQVDFERGSRSLGGGVLRLWACQLCVRVVDWTEVGQALTAAIRQYGVEHHPVLSKSAGKGDLHVAPTP